MRSSTSAAWHKTVPSHAPAVFSEWSGLGAPGLGVGVDGDNLGGRRI